MRERWCKSRAVMLVAPLYAVMPRLPGRRAPMALLVAATLLQSAPLWAQSSLAGGPPAPSEISAPGGVLLPPILSTPAAPIAGGEVDSAGAIAVQVPALGAVAPVEVRPLPGPAPEPTPVPASGALGAPAAKHAASGLPLTPPLQLRRSALLRDVIPQAERGNLPTFLSGDRTLGQTDFNTVLQGNAELRRGDLVVRGDRLEYNEPDDLATVLGDAYINRAGDIFSGPKLELHVDAMEGTFDRPSYRFLRNGAHGTAERVDFIDADNTVIHNGTYTTCERRPGPSWMPDWMISARSISIDQASQQGVAKDATMQFLGLKTPPLPSISFPLSDARQSGLLPPVFGISNQSGIETTLPYYWNIAPNRDATLYPTVYSKRGVDLGGEFRYMEDNYRGQIRGDYLPSDKLRDGESRWGIAALHTATINTGISSIGNLGLSLNVNRVSDDNYWQDFPNTNPSLTQRLLPTDLNLSWGKGDLQVAARSLKWQTLQQVGSPIIPPYDRLPELNARYSKVDVGGFDYSIEGDYTRFQAAENLTNQPNARRSYAAAQISRPFIAPGAFFTPKVLLHATHYDFDYALPNNATSADVAVPTVSLDSGLIFERDTRLFGRNLIQTLEPRAFYVNTPYRNQNLLPNYDSAVADFNFASIYTENGFVGNDRISDSNLLTLGLTTRLIDSDTGAQAASFGVAQRLRLKDQRVVLPGEEVITDRLSDFLVGGSINWTPKWAFDSTIQYNPKTGRSDQSSIGGRYSPGNYHTLSAAYRYQRGISESIDVGWQWPLNDLWGDRGQNLGPGRGQGPGRIYAVGRLNYSLMDKSIVDSVSGFEYEGDCWVGRVVLERLQSSGTTATKRLLFQIEFFGFSQVGSNPLAVLQQNVPRYQYLHQETTTPSRFSQYD
jgi:LPS-assembly protein